MKDFNSNIQKRKTFLRSESFLRTVLILVLLCISAVGFAQSHSSAFNVMYKQVKVKNFFKARDLFAGNKKELPTAYQYFMEAVLDNAFNKPEESNQKISQLLTLKTSIPDSLMFKLWRIREDNSMKQYNYSEAKRAVQTTLQKYDYLLTDEERKDLKNNLKIWTVLENKPPQKITLNGGTRLKMVKDVAGLKNLKVKVVEDSMNFIFDRGANISTISASTASRLKINVIPADIEVDAITGIAVKADLAVCEKMTFGNIIAENVVFLVFADDALSFPQINYQINGVLGFPVIEALREVQLTQDDYFIVPNTETKINSPSNMAMDGLTPLIFMDGRHFSFDTGSDYTILYAPFYQENKKKIDMKYRLGAVTMGGAGGKIEYPGFKVNYTFHILGKEIPLKNINLLTTKINEKTVYGNIGQDVIRQFSKMTLNFNQMFIKFD
ncbi:retropepsin-like aspartic protease [Chryseobacterium sp.]|uniref:retropepsin-like aspartic protease n=1 Tax=Chryseobacterium sp. TaxID=1871047 RepID=UPI00262961BF|nr:retropepsin-like aspartic protease [Chryseobacterium sp.]